MKLCVRREAIVMVVRREGGTIVGWGEGLGGGGCGCGGRWWWTDCTCAVGVRHYVINIIPLIRFMRTEYTT